MYDLYKAEDFVNAQELLLNLKEMYNQDIYNKLEQKFGGFNMPLICEGIGELYKLLSIDALEHRERYKTSEFIFESDWWLSAVEKANELINKT